MKFFEGKSKIFTQKVIVNDGGITKEDCIKLANSNGWWFYYAEYKLLPKNKRKEIRWHFIKITNKNSIRQKDYTTKKIKGHVCFPPKIYLIQ
jgi:hypothetical protein